MTIECSKCEDTDSFCIYDDDGWICRRCFLNEGHDYEEWNDRCDQAARERQLKRNRDANNEYSNYNPIIRRNNKDRECKFGCGTMLYWDDTLDTRNKFTETETKKQHSFFRCSLAKVQKRKSEEEKERNNIEST